MKGTAKGVQAAPVDAEAQLATFVAKFEPKHQLLIRAVRKRCASDSRLPTVSAKQRPRRRPPT